MVVASTPLAAEVFGPQDRTLRPVLLSPTSAWREVVQAYQRSATRPAGSARVEFTIGADGTVEPGSVVVVNASHAALGRAAQAAVAAFRFAPGSIDGTPVRVRAPLPVVHER